jgi:hypothetical protein
LFIFGGATAIAVAILAISQRLLAKRRDGEQRALLAGHLSSDNNHLIYRSIEFSALKCMQRIGKGTFGEVGGKEHRCDDEIRCTRECGMEQKWVSDRGIHTSILWRLMTYSDQVSDHVQHECRISG